MGGLRVGFLNGPKQPRLKTINIVCGITQKRLAEAPSTETSGKKKKPNETGRVINMVIHQDGKTHQVQVLLDTGCSVALINKKTGEKLGNDKKCHLRKRGIENFVGEKVERDGQYYTKPLLLQHRRYFSWEKFEITPMDPEIDIFLPFKWVTQHPPKGACTPKEVRFNSLRCLDKCTKFEQRVFSFTWDESVSLDPSAQTIGYVASVATESPDVAAEFRKYLDIMRKEAADALPEHRPYDCKIDLQEGSTAPWGSIYPISEVKLQMLGEWLKEMERTGKIKWSMSPAGSPILFVPKPHRRGLRLRGLLGVEPNHHPQSIPAASDARTTRAGTGGTMVYQDGSKK